MAQDNVDIVYHFYSSNPKCHTAQQRETVNNRNDKDPAQSESTSTLNYFLWRKIDKDICDCLQLGLSGKTKFSTDVFELICFGQSFGLNMLDLFFYFLIISVRPLCLRKTKGWEAIPTYFILPQGTVRKTHKL